MSFKTDRGQVSGLGAANEGVKEWWNSRMTSVALIPLTLLFLAFVAPLIGEDHATVVAAFQSPLRAIVAILFLGIVFLHLASGYQEIIVDYVHGKATLPILLVTMKLLCWAAGFAGAFAVAKLAFAG
jgi:succinate dehydrogenase / fumarate reductase membrane anchor subunit